MNLLQTFAITSRKDHNIFTFIGLVLLIWDGAWLLPDGHVMNTDVLLRHAEQQVWKLDAQEERKVLHLPVHVQEVQQTGLHKGQGW